VASGSLFKSTGTLPKRRFTRYAVSAEMPWGSNFQANRFS
jgi:hypothetical protein